MSAQHVLVGHEFAVVLAHRAGRRPVAGIRLVRTARPFPYVAVYRQRARLCELNVVEQVAHVCQTSILRDAWERGQAVTVHGWIYGLHDGLLSDLKTTIDCQDDVLTSYEAAIATLPGTT